jgi:hypothetical protein
VSSDEQKQRFLDRLDQPDKNRILPGGPGRSDALGTFHAGAFRLPVGDRREVGFPVRGPARVHTARVGLGADVISTTIRSLDLRFPQVTAGQREGLAESKRRLLAE